MYHIIQLFDLHFYYKCLRAKQEEDFLTRGFFIPDTSAAQKNLTWNEQSNFESYATGNTPDVQGSWIIHTSSSLPSVETNASK